MSTRFLTLICVVVTVGAVLLSARPAFGGGWAEGGPQVPYPPVLPVCLPNTTDDCLPGPEPESGYPPGPLPTAEQLACLNELMVLFGPMEEALFPLMESEPAGPKLETGFPYYLVWPSTGSPVQLIDSTGLLSSGMMTSTAIAADCSVQFWMRLYEGDTVWNLTLNASESSGELTLHGWLVVIDHSTSPSTSTTHEGGWLFNPVDGIRVHPGTEADFDDQLAAMMHRPLTGDRAFDLGTIVTTVGNVLRIGIHYILDAFTAYSVPTSCGGPMSDCDEGEVSCEDNIAQYCVDHINDLPDVPQWFKKCMKGRCGCGGSSFPVTRITCAEVDSCGPCSYTQALGCNIAGEQIWYCGDSEFSLCECATIVFHEMSHACGSQDLQNGAWNDSYRIGDWFGAQVGEECNPN